jgi:hypothetical protein
MRIRGLAVLALVVMMLGLVFYPQGAAQGTDGPAEDATTIKMHFKGADGLTTISPAAGNSTEETKNCNGKSWGSRRSGTIVGEWAFLPTGNLVVGGSFKADLWAKSDSGAKNAGFRININDGGNGVSNYFSDRMDLASPHKFTISGSLSHTFRAGNTFSAQLIWFSDPNYGVGPSSGGVFIYGSKDHDSLMEITLAAPPVTMNVTGVDREGSSFKVNAKVNESLGMPPDSITYGLAIQGPAVVTADHLSKPTVSSGDNGTSVSWLWNFRKSKAQTGMYTFTVTVAYSNESTFSNATQMIVKIDAQTTTPPGLLSGGNSTFSIILVVVVVVVACLVVAFIFIRKRRVKKARLVVEPEPVAAV